MPRPGPRGAAPSGEKPGVSRPEAEAAPPAGLREPLPSLGSGGSDQVKVTHCPVRPPTWWGRRRSSKFQREVPGASPGLRPPAPPPPSLSPCALEAAGLEEVLPCEPPGDSGRRLAGGRAGPVARRWGWPSGGGHGCCGSRGLWAAGVRLAGGAWPAATWLLRRFVAGHCPAARPASGPLRPLLTLPLFSFF